MSWFLFCLRNYTKFTGRASRREFWSFYLLFFLTYIILALLDSLLGKFSWEKGMGPLSGIFALATVVPSLAAGARRLHDTGRSGWWQILYPVPLVGFVIVMVLLAWRGQANENRFGPPPTHEPDASEA
jgi:uncharacterized membrane protein YhaH (DUF805 family)